MASDKAAEKFGRKWTAGKAATADVEPWLAFRYLLAAQYNAHQPQGKVQQATKTRAARLAGLLVGGLGGALYAPQPPGLAGDVAWLGFTQAVIVLDPAHHVSLMWVLWRARWGGPSQDQARRHQMQALDLTLCDMRAQQRANAQGWSAESGWPKIRARRRS